MGIRTQKINDLVEALDGYVGALIKFNGIYDTAHKTYMRDVCNTITDRAQELIEELE